MENTRKYSIKGFREIVISVRDIEQALEFYTSVFDYELVSRHEHSEDWRKFWKLDKSASIEQVLLKGPDHDFGQLRLVSFKNVPQRHIRDSAQSWDTGGIYDIDCRTKDIDKSYEELQARGWTAYSAPMEYHFGHFHVKEVLMHGQGDAVLALIQRYAPELEGYPSLSKISNAFNSSQIVRDIDVSKKFYIDQLGFQIYMEENLKGSDRDTNVFGAPNNFYKEIKRNITIVHPDKTNHGSVELVHLEGFEGTDFAEFACPPNLGLLMLRFPVKGIAELKKHLENESLPIENFDVVDGLEVLAIRSPDGAWLEFVEYD